MPEGLGSVTKFNNGQTSHHIKGRKHKPLKRLPFDVVFPDEFNYLLLCASSVPKHRVNPKQERKCHTAVKSIYRVKKKMKIKKISTYRKDEPRLKTPDLGRGSFLAVGQRKNP